MSSSSGYVRSSQRASISPLRSRKSPAGPAKPAGRPTTPSSSSTSSRPSTKASISSVAAAAVLDLSKAKENVSVTVRFRPLSGREINKGDEVAWYADGDHIVRNEYNPSIAYGFDKVFGPATTTRHVYDVAAHHVVSGAMEGINGTVFAYGVTSSGKTHTMHGEQKSPGIIPLAVKDVFSIIQETPGREFLLRVSYLEIYNEVINDLLDPIGQNLRIREDAQGTYVEGIKEEVVLSPAHALSLIATGEEHRHVGSNNFNLVSSRSHTIFTLTIESSSRGENTGEEDVTLSHLHLIDLAGSESSKAETTGLRRKEGSYINKSLLTLGTVIAKLTDGKATHIPYRDSKLTRLLQSSLSGHGRISLICTVTPASSSSEETHNTLKFAHRSKHVEIKASQNKILDEKSLIKKYQREISELKQELQHLKRGMVENPNMATSSQEDLVNLKLQLEAGQSKLKSRLEEEEQAKAALMGRIQRLTKLILVSTKNTMSSSIPERPSHRRRHSFGEDELAYLPDRKRESWINDDAGSHASVPSPEEKDDVINLDELGKDYKRSKRRGMLGWLKLRKPDNVDGLSPNVDSEGSANGSPASGSKLTSTRVMLYDMKDSRRNSVSRKDNAPAINSFPGRTQAGDLFSLTVGGRELPPTGTTVTDQMDLLREQVKMLAGEVAFCISSLRRLSEEAANKPEDIQLQEDMHKLKGEISQKKNQIRILEQRMIGSLGHAPSNSEMSQALSKLTTELNEKIFELEIKSADNRILQEQLQLKNSENAEMQETIISLKKQINFLDKSSTYYRHVADNETDYSIDVLGKADEAQSIKNLNVIVSQVQEGSNDSIISSEILVQAAEIENLRQENVRLAEEKDGLEIQSQKLAEEASYAKDLAAAAAVELRNLAEEVTKLTYENAELSGDLAAAKETPGKSNLSPASYESKQNVKNNFHLDGKSKKRGNEFLIEELQKDLSARLQREAALEAALSVKVEVEADLRRTIDEIKHQKQDLEYELSSLQILVSKMRKSGINVEDKSTVHVRDDVQTKVKSGYPTSNGYSHRKQYKEAETLGSMEDMIALEELRANYQRERRRCKELESHISILKGEDIAGLDVLALEELQNLHIEAITKICQAKYANQNL
ncbi:kinesin-like protein KIN-7C, mitochondrial isoform X2 [Vigna radiata var. radiata]|uniref:Kinesin-like protein KIN-7C, mitochondrial isoform X2 n=1 Tax=Vigna radiata var. radiata TaxID=3916 RepID=A0A1S3UFC4_VIGRR|nr:kinesin-like protein KIN-7C, mitochondrial isoform X2 [Vigna radiata var. radiata]